ncbi:MAG: Sterol 3-beta-glucosyltransferase [Trizodia sp. TS-e1964]|nr:MAG: Sterol 3-beta-glucosyltransferase [Trizodia sp. TS-e1964]
MSPAEEARKWPAQRKKTTRRRRDALDVPERFKDGADAHEDVTAPPRGTDGRYMNQSVFSMITAAGSTVDFNSRFDESSESEGEDSKKTQDKLKGLDPEKKDVEPPMPGAGKQIKKSLEYKLLKSLPKLSLKTKKEKNYMAKTSLESPGGSREPSTNRSRTPRESPVMSRMIRAEAKVKSFGSSEETEKAKENLRIEEDDGFGASSSLALRLMEIFKFEKPEAVISEYPCWLLQSVLLQGYMYITQQHICFYAYLPKKSNIVAKSGFLGKRGKKNPTYSRFYFELKGDVLSYYNDRSDLYFPHGNVDLRYGISASLSESKEKGKDSKYFTVITEQRKYHFHADSASSAKEWVRSLQKVIFRSHNEGDSVKISLPIENIVDVEESPVIEFADTFKIQVINNDETYAMDEYFFSFFSFGKDAIKVLRILIDDTAAQHIPANLLRLPGGHDAEPSPQSTNHDDNSSRHSHDLRSRSPLGAATPILHESVRATLAPLSPTGNNATSRRISGDFGRSSSDYGRRSLDANRELSRPSFDHPIRSPSVSRATSFSKTRPSRRGDKSPPGKNQGSSDSFVHSLEPESSALQSSDDTRPSASQILNRSDVFQSPTIQRVQKSMRRVSNDQELYRASEESARSTPSKAGIHIDSHSRSHTRRVLTKLAPGKYGENAPSEDDEESRGRLQASNSSPTLQELVRAGSYPLQRAAGFAGYLKSKSKRMSNLLATESMGYLEKVSGMWAGGQKHYDEDSSQAPEQHPEELDDEEQAIEYGDRFRSHFTRPSEEKLQATYFAYLHRVLPLYGKIYISNRSFCFRSLVPGTRTKMILPMQDLENVNKEKGFRFGYSGLVLVIRGHEELFFEFRQSESRDDCAVTLIQNLESVRYLKESGLLSREEKASAEEAKVEHRLLQEARQDGHNNHDINLPQTADETAHPNESPTILFDDPRVSIINFKPTQSLRITCLTIGSRGDVQPYIALCKGLLAEGHRPRIATHAEFEPWVRKHGIDFAPVDGDPAELMRICVEYGMFTYSFLREASSKFRGWIDELLVSAWKACQDSDILIESPSAMAGIHIAEALGIPYYRAFTMPWTRTRAYPHAFAVPEHKMGGAYNYVTYVMFDNVFWKAIAGQVNRWRKNELGLGSTGLDKMQPNKVPFLYNFSPSVVVPPLDYSDWIRVTGYWFLDESETWEPPKELSDFIDKARQDKKKIVYVGFGSIVVSDPAAMTKTIVESVINADVRCILSKGWSDRLGNKDASKPEVPLPAEIFQIKSAPHDWLFERIDAAVHHGGAGTTGASLRAGIPTVIKPFFGDQYFFGSRVEDLGVGIHMKKLNVSVFSRALWEATTDQRMINKAKVLGDEIRKENGVETAIQSIYRDMEYAKTLIKKRGSEADETQEEFEESWTFIGDETDPELTRNIMACEPLGVKESSIMAPLRNRTVKPRGLIV